ncbi:hypothetical protein ACPV5S_20115 [Vibrio astriarenae]
MIKERHELDLYSINIDFDDDEFLPFGIESQEDTDPSKVMIANKDPAACIADHVALLVGEHHNTYEDYQGG